MRFYVGAALAASLAFVTPAPASGEAAVAEQSGPRYSVAAIRFEIPDKTKIGRKKAGLLCLPNGSLRWRDIVRPPAASIVRSVLAALLEAGLDVAPPPDEIFEDQQRATPYRIVATVIAAKISLCMPRWGMGDRASVRGKGSLTVAWTIYSRATRTADETMTVDQDFEFGEGGTAEALRSGLAENARSFGRAYLAKGE